MPGDRPQTIACVFHRPRKNRGWPERWGCDLPSRPPAATRRRRQLEGEGNQACRAPFGQRLEPQSSLRANPGGDEEASLIKLETAETGGGIMKGFMMAWASGLASCMLLAHLAWLAGAPAAEAGRDAPPSERV